MDLASIKPQQIDLELFVPGTDRPAGLTLHLVSEDDERVRDVIAANDAEIIEVVRGQKGKADLSRDVQERLARRKYSAHVVGWTWTGDGSWKGKKPEFSQELLAELFDALPWVVREVRRTVNDEDGFYGHLLGK